MCDTCDTCRFWGDYDKENLDESHDANAKHVSEQSGYEFRICLRAKDYVQFLDDRGLKADPEEFISSDLEIYSSAVITGPKFGCVLHQKA